MKFLSKDVHMPLRELPCSVRPRARLPACSDRGGVEEAVEELKDEAKDTKEAIEDEIDDDT